MSTVNCRYPDKHWKDDVIHIATVRTASNTHQKYLERPESFRELLHVEGEEFKTKYLFTQNESFEPSPSYIALLFSVE